MFLDVKQPLNQTDIPHVNKILYYIMSYRRYYGVVAIFLCHTETGKLQMKEIKQAIILYNYDLHEKLISIIIKLRKDYFFEVRRT